MIILIIFLIYYFVVASAGICAGYVMDIKKHTLKKYLRCRRKSIKKGKLIIFFYGNYKVYHKNNDKFVYKKCFNYAKKFNQQEINFAITYLKSDIKVFDAIGLLVTVCAGLSTPMINSYVEYFITLFDVKNEKSVGNLFGLLYILFLVLFVRKIALLMRKQIFLLNILENAKEYIIDREKKEHSA